MEANELMLGDYIYDLYGNKAIVRKLEDYNEHAKASGACIELVEGPEEGKTFCLYGQIEPIPITTEILENNGFVKVPHEYEYPECQCWTNDVDGSYSFEIVADKHRKPYILGNGDMGDYEWVNFECKYVHELQHALRLAGIKKEIVL